MLECVKTSLFVAIGVAHVKGSLARWYISRSIVSERIDRQAHGILKGFSIILRARLPRDRRLAAREGTERGGGLRAGGV